MIAFHFVVHPVELPQTEVVLLDLGDVRSYLSAHPLQLLQLLLEADPREALILQLSLKHRYIGLIAELREVAHRLHLPQLRFCCRRVLVFILVLILLIRIWASVLRRRHRRSNRRSSHRLSY